MTGRHGVGQLPKFEGEPLQFLAKGILAHPMPPVQPMRPNASRRCAVVPLDRESQCAPESFDRKELSPTSQVKILFPLYCTERRSIRTSPASIAEPTSQPTTAMEPAGMMASPALRFCTRTRFGLFLSYST